VNALHIVAGITPTDSLYTSLIETCALSKPANATRKRQNR